MAIVEIAAELRRRRGEISETCPCFTVTVRGGGAPSSSMEVWGVGGWVGGLLGVGGGVGSCPGAERGAGARGLGVRE